MTYTISWITLIIIYIVLVCVNLIGVIIYREAFHKMKRTLMIRAVYILLLALLFENVYFTLTALTVGYESVIGNILMNPLMWVVPKFILLLAIGFFIYASLKPTIYLK